MHPQNTIPEIPGQEIFVPSEREKVLENLADCLQTARNCKADHETIVWIISNTGLALAFCERLLSVRHFGHSEETIQHLFSMTGERP